MIRRIFKFLAWTFVALIATGVLLYAVGFRVQLDGGGMPNLVRIRSEEDRAEEIARHRGRTLLTLDTVTGGAAEALYKSLGYRVAGVIPRYARTSLTTDMDDTTFMYKELSAPCE